ncbi:MAG TPA: hypothetical protein VG537_03920 [Candidatus Kapabacteria bacterium]|jgi:hypothetical protein|nr:hypothetical protein [Candidatus Kapabacteria bacterium]
MSTISIDSKFTNSVFDEMTQVRNIPDHDIAEIAIGFGRHSTTLLHGANTDYRTTTAGPVTFRRVDPLREPLRVADARLQKHLESLCETLRAKY